MGYRKSKVSKVWNSDFAYVVGIIATDGNLSSDLRHLIITSKDREVVKKCKEALGLKNKIGRKARGGSRIKKYYTLQFGDKNFFEFLLRIGLTPKKSKTISQLEIPEAYFKDFFRGCIDGDGSISISPHPESRHPQYKVRLCSASKNFLTWILVSCRKILGIKGGSISKTKKSSVFTLTLGKSDSIAVLGIIYSGNVICLSRKRKRALKILGE